MGRTILVINDYLGNIPFSVELAFRPFIGFGIEIDLQYPSHRYVDIFLPLLRISAVFVVFHHRPLLYVTENWWQNLVAFCCGGVFFSDGVGFYEDESGEHFNWLFRNTLRCGYLHFVTEEQEEEDDDDRDDDYVLENYSDYYDDDETP